jgi:hypothetical protein
MFENDNKSKRVNMKTITDKPSATAKIYETENDISKNRRLEVNTLAEGLVQLFVNISSLFTPNPKK